MGTLRDGEKRVAETQNEQLKILLIEDDPNHVRLCQTYLEEVEDIRFELEHVERLSAGIQSVKKNHFDAVLLDLRLPDSSGLDTFHRFHEAHPHVPTVVSTGMDPDGIAAKAVKSGAEDYLVKDGLDGPLLARTIRHAIERAGRRRAERVLGANKIEMDIARRIQQGLYPTTAPETPGYDIAGVSRPCAAVGGDYYDFIRMPDESLGIAVGDASGHGLGPALMMAQARATLRTLSYTYRGVGEILSIANRLLYESTLDDHFFTLVFTRLELTSRVLVYSSAGHPTGLVFDERGEVRTELPSVGLPLGLEPDVSFHTGGSVALRAGDMVLLYSDGLLEPIFETGRRFGIDRVIDAVRDHCQRPARGIVDGILERLTRHCGSNRPSDDVTAVVVKVQG
jgi:sigma-B regulation protein RsbU (phosphoserine phosphatase)